MNEGFCYILYQFNWRSGNGLSIHDEEKGITSGDSSQTTGFMGCLDTADRSPHRYRYALAGIDTPG
jgi:hypothetical protein